MKTGILKKEGYKYKFEYMQRENLPATCKKSAKGASKMTDEDKKKHLEEANKIWKQKNALVQTEG